MVDLSHSWRDYHYGQPYAVEIGWQLSDPIDNDLGHSLFDVKSKFWSPDFYAIREAPFILTVKQLQEEASRLRWLEVASSHAVGLLLIHLTSVFNIS